MFNFIFSESFLTSAISYALPIIFAAYAALISNKAGIVNINIEGSMSVAAVTGALVSHYTSSWVIGLCCAVIVGMLMSLILAYASLRLNADSFLCGIALNTMASGLCVLALYIVLGVKGDSSIAPSSMVPDIKIPLLSEIPVIGPAFFNQNLLFYIVILVLALLIFLLKCTRLGLYIKTVGFNPTAAASVGVNVNRIKTVSLLLCGAMAGLGGAYLSMANLGFFSSGMVGGRGFIGIAAEAMGTGIPWLTTVFALLFGAVDYFAVGAQTVLSFPYELLNTLPYLMTLIALTIYYTLRNRQGGSPARRKKLNGGTIHGKKAWEIEYETMKNSIPVILEEEEQGWSFSERIEEVEDIYNRQKWHSNVPGSGATEHVIIAAMQDMENMGYDVTAAEAMIEDGEKYLALNDTAALAGHTARTFSVIMNSPKIPDHPYWKHTIYESFEQYAAAVKFGKYDYDKSSPDFLERTYIGWQAQICAGAIGTAVEGYMTQNIRKSFGEIYGYVRTPNTYNDDITYEIALLRAVEKAGADITSADIAEQWVALVPMAWSAEEVALKNLKLGIFPPQSGYQNNPYREWIGAQMRGAVCGMLAPGDTEKAARLAYMDGQVSHHNNGVLGEVFNAVMTSLAYVKSDIREIVRESIKLIPADSEYRTVVDFALKQCLCHDDWESAWKECEKKYIRYNWIHAYPNAAAEVIALWYGNGDFDETMHICAMQGYDVDCNAAQIATALVIATNKPVDKKWHEPIGDVLNTYMRNTKTLSIRELSEYTTEMAVKLDK